MIYLSFFLFFLSSIYEAGAKPQTNIHPTTKEILENINQFNQQKPQDKQCQHCLRFSGVKQRPQPENELLQQCAVDLCGPARENLMYVLNNDTFNKEDIDPEIAKRFSETIQPAIEKALQEEREYNKGALKLLQDKLNPEPNITPQEWDELAEALSLQIMMDNSAAIMSTGFTNTSSGITSFNIDNYPSETARNGDTSYRAHKAKIMSTSVSAALFQLSSPSLDRQRDLLRERYQDFLQDYQNNKTKFTKEERQTIAQLGKALKSKNLNGLSFADNLDRLIKKSKDIFFCIDADCKKWVLDALASLHQNLKESTSESGHAQRLTQQLNHCQSVYNMSTQNAQQVKRYRQNFNQYIDQFISKTFANYSVATRRSYKGYMRTINFELPSEQGIEEQLTNEIRVEASHMTAHSDNTIADFIQNRERFTDSHSLCPSFMKISDSGDYFERMTNTVGISNFSCHFHDHGKQTLAHELAHTLSHWFGQYKQDLGKSRKPSRRSYRQYMKLRRCANKRYKTTDKSKTKIYVGFGHNNDQFRTEEDMADLITHQVFQEEPTLSQCSLLSSSNGVKYDFPDILYPPVQKNLQVIPDPHSTPLLRAITEAIHKRKTLSPACQQVVDTYSDRINFEPCFEK